MAEKVERVPSEFVVETASFYSPSGFEGGELLRPAFPPLSAAELRELLVDVLYEHVIPQLDQTVQTLQIPGVRNPLRATSVDGTPVTWNSERGFGPPITPAVVKVSLAQVMASAKKRRIPSSGQKL